MEKKTALLIIDMQNGILKKAIYNRYSLINNINCLIDNFHRNNQPVYFIQHTNMISLKANSSKWELSEQLHMLSKDKIFTKGHSSIFKEKVFTSDLNKNDINKLVVVGLVSNGCVKASCIDGISKGFSITLIRDAHSTYHKDAEKLISDWNEQLEYEGANVITLVEYLNSRMENQDQVKMNELDGHKDITDEIEKVNIAEAVESI